MIAGIERRRREAIRRTFTRLDPVALGAGVAVAGGLLGLVLPGRLLFGGPPAAVVDTIGRLTYFFPGFDVSPLGAVIGALWFALAGFAAGFLTATFRNVALRFVLWKMRWDAARWRRRHFLDEI